VLCYSKNLSMASAIPPSSLLATTVCAASFTCRAIFTHFCDKDLILTACLCNTNDVHWGEVAMRGQRISHGEI